MKTHHLTLECPLITSIPDLIEYLKDAKQLALNRLTEHNDGPHNRLYDYICQALATAECLEADHE